MLLPVPAKPPRYIDPLSDFGFKYLFGNERHKEIMIGFLNALFKGQKMITDISYQTTEYGGDYVELRKVFFDLSCITQDGECFILEMQRREQEYFKDRCIYYVSRKINQQLRRGKSNWDTKLKGVYLIGLLDFRFKDSQDGQYISDHLITNADTGAIFYQKLGFKFLELPNFTKSEKEIITPLDQWVYVLKNMSRLKEIPSFLNEPVFEEIFKLAEISNLTKEERMLYESGLKAKWDYDNTIAFAREEGIEKGKYEEKKNTAMKLKEMGMPIDSIIKITGFTDKEIEQL
ncbi:Rpn family recombination-promoting nuclease/putative transposase [Pedobacter sp. L105]|uniref:Rpn family recombination-promoting nuclease/putative transposase n=1 Tax=Pedobacter sp. L105 TaxID=1641871 RepID=UPI00131BD4F2|nr:Rpn family recombination-promoting nuclease/putative transposase [Pedobacter sp. L105]